MSADLHSILSSEQPDVVQVGTSNDSPGMLVKSVLSGSGCHNQVPDQPDLVQLLTVTAQQKAMLVRHLIVAARNRKVEARNRKGVAHNAQGCTLVFCNSITQMDKLHDEVQVLHSMQCHQVSSVSACYAGLDPDAASQQQVHDTRAGHVLGWSMPAAVVGCIPCLIVMTNSISLWQRTKPGPFICHEARVRVCLCCCAVVLLC